MRLADPICGDSTFFLWQNLSFQPFVCKFAPDFYQEKGMKKLLLQNLGIIILLLGVVVLALHYFAAVRSNAYLAAGLALIIVGIVSYLIINKRLK